MLRVHGIILTKWPLGSGSHSLLPQRPGVRGFESRLLSARDGGAPQPPQTPVWWA